jgi:DNA repair protein RecN (Recombination protein N)
VRRELGFYDEDVLVRDEIKVLKELSVKNFAIIEKLDISLSGGLTCLTGETGAGKSILADAVGALLGGRAGAEFARIGGGAYGGEQAGETAVEGIFDLSGYPEVKALLEGKGLPAEDDLVVRRLIFPRGRAYINGCLVNLSALQEIGEHLADIHGQHDHQSLLKADRQLKLLDEFCRAAALYSRYAEKYRELSGFRAALGGFEAGARERAQRLDLLLFQRDEIDKAELSPSEEDDLNSERSRLLHADRLRVLSQDVLASLRDSESPALTAVGETKKVVKEMEGLTGFFGETLRLVEGAEVSLTEACSAIRDFERTLEADPERLSIVEERLDLISRLKKKYGETVRQVLSYRDGLEDELNSLAGAEEDLDGLKAKISEAEASLLSLGRELSGMRRAGARNFGEKIRSELAELGMAKAEFKVEFYPQEKPGPQGMEKAEFLFSANPGEGLKPLSKVASGGELSRVMLALKVILSGADRVPTLIFDEVDSGIGGKTAVAVGKKLRQAAARRQVLCITHLPQIASQAGEHFVVEKKTDGKRTKVTIHKLDKDERVREVARMLGDDESSAASAHAAELVKRGGEVV